MRRLPLRLLRSAAAASLRPAPSRASCGGHAPPPPSPSPASPAADLSRWAAPPRRGYSQFSSGFSPLKRKPLGSILDVERAKGLSPEQLVAAWDDYHLGRGHIGASMSAKLYHLMEQRSATCRHFVIPLWKGSGYTTMFMQVQMPHMIFTGLEDYKARGTQASPYYTITHYTEFAETKDTVLIRGDVVFTSKLTDSEAKCLLETAHSFYLNDVRYRLVERFNKETHEFEFNDVLQVLDMPTM
uniref:ATP synthase mitochondrial F1 complex assembly factor 1 n=1 Tax=Leersia perrieri TaxID=77586 RepID=A0A0D9VF98_9ORYZ